jgi:hypothetical protein
MLDHTHQPSARLLARLRMTATEHKLPPEFADILAQDPKMTAVRMAEIAPGLLLIADLGKRKQLKAEEIEEAVGEYITALGSDTPAADPQVLALARESILNMVADRDDQGGRTHEPTLSVGRSWDGGEGLRAKMVDGLTARMVRSHTPTIGREFASMSLSDMLMTIQRAAGERPASRLESVRMAFGQHTRSDFPLITADALSNAVGLGMVQAPPDIARASREVQRENYQQGRSLTLSSTTIPAEIGEAGEITFGSMDEKGELLPKVRDFGVGFSISNQAIVNDRLDLLSDIASNMRRGATERLRRVLLEPLEANSGAGQNMADGNPMFTVGRGNMVASGAVLSVASLTVARNALRTAKGPRGETFALKPWAILTHPLQETVAQQVLTQIAANQVSNVNPFGGQLELIIEPGLASTTGWYLLADPSLNDGLTHAFLSGQQTPKVESRAGWETLGMDFRLVWALDAKFVETATWFRNPGA